MPGLAGPFAGEKIMEYKAVKGLGAPVREAEIREDLGDGKTDCEFKGQRPFRLCGSTQIGA
jgi:hypothetical protein